MASWIFDWLQFYDKKRPLQKYLQYKANYVLLCIITYFVMYIITYNIV